MSLSKPTDIRLVDNGIIYELRRLNDWDWPLYAVQFSNNPGPLYIKGPGLFGEYKPSGVTQTKEKSYVIFERQHQTEKGRLGFNGFQAILIEIEDCYYIKNKQLK